MLRFAGTGVEDCLGLDRRPSGVPPAPVVARGAIGFATIVTGAIRLRGWSDWFGRDRDLDRSVPATDAGPRDGHDPDRIRSEPGTWNPDRAVPVEPLELACPVSRAGSDWSAGHPRRRL